MVLQKNTKSALSLRIIYVKFCKIKMGDIVNMKGRAIELVKAAVEADTAGNYEQALKLYLNSLEYFEAHLKFEKNPSAKKMIMAKARKINPCNLVSFMESSRHCLVLDALLRGGGTSSVHRVSGAR